MTKQLYNTDHRNVLKTLGAELVNPSDLLNAEYISAEKMVNQVLAINVKVEENTSIISFGSLLKTVTVTVNKKDFNVTNYELNRYFSLLEQRGTPIFERIENGGNWLPSLLNHLENDLSSQVVDDTTFKVEPSTLVVENRTFYFVHHAENSEKFDGYAPYKSPVVGKGLQNCLKKLGWKNAFPNEQEDLFTPSELSSVERGLLSTEYVIYHTQNGTTPLQLRGILQEGAEEEFSAVIFNVQVALQAD